TAGCLAIFCNFRRLPIVAHTGTQAWNRERRGSVYFDWRPLREGVGMPLLGSSSLQVGVTLVIMAIVILGLSLGAEILIPLAIAIIFAFILAPIVRQLERRRLPQPIAVAIAMSGLVVLILALSTAFSAQMLSLTAGLTQYRSNLVEKVRTISSVGRDAGL